MYNNQQIKLRHKKRFVLIFDSLQNVHLFKDVGQVPLQMGLHFDYEPMIVCQRNLDTFPCSGGFVSSLAIDSHNGHPYYWLYQNSVNIDVLMLFHISTSTIYRGLLYKLRNPDGCLYVKADASHDKIAYTQWNHKNPFTVLKRKVLFRIFLKIVDIVSFETIRSFIGATKILQKRKLLLPNGFDPEIITHLGIKQKNFSEKENMILLVGRHGDPAKNSEFMLDVLELLEELGAWQVYFIGPTTLEFDRRRKKFENEYPELAAKVSFVGAVNDKKILFEYYNSAKIFCLTSRTESWGMVCVEALAFANVLLMTEVISAADLTAGGKAGIVVAQGDKKSYASSLKRLMNEPEFLLRLHQQAAEHFNQHFIWKHILDSLNSKINEKTSHAE